MATGGRGLFEEFIVDTEQVSQITRAKLKIERMHEVSIKLNEVAKLDSKESKQWIRVEGDVGDRKNARVMSESILLTNRCDPNHICPKSTNTVTSSIQSNSKFKFKILFKVDTYSIHKNTSSNELLKSTVTSQKYFHTKIFSNIFRIKPLIFITFSFHENRLRNDFTSHEVIP